MRLIAFKYGATEITEQMAFQGGSENIKLPIALLFFLIEYENKKILIDVGCDTMPGFELIEFENPVKVLETYGVKRSENPTVGPFENLKPGKNKILVWSK